MFLFEAKTYNQKVLAPLRGEKPDEFARYCLELSDDDTERIRARLADVRSHWRNNSTAGGAVGQVIKALLREHSILEGQLGDADERRRLRERLQAAKAEADAAKWTRIDRALNDTHRGHGGIPNELRVDIVQLGEGVGLGAAEVERHIDEAMRRNGWQVVVLSQVSGVEPLADAQARNIEQRVRQFRDARQHEMRDTVPVRSLFEALGLQMDADPQACALAITALEEKLNTQIKRDSDYGTAGRRVLELAKANLTGKESIDRYCATFVGAVQRELEGDFRSMTMDGHINAQENEQLLQIAVSSGLTDAYARELIDLLCEASAKTGKSISRETGTRVQLISCAACRAPDSIGSGNAYCLSCGAALYRSCPACDRDIPRGDAVCRYCQHSLQAALQLDMLLREGRGARDAGRPDQAARSAAAALQLDPQSSEASELAAQSQAAIQRARTSWRAVREALSQRRLYAARSGVHALDQEASDVEDGGQLPAELQRELADDLEVVEKRLASARAETVDAQRERMFAEILVLAADCEAAQRALSQIPPQPPSQVEAHVVDGAVQLHWSPSSSPGVSGYLVFRAPERPPSDPGHGDAVGGTTSGTAQVDSAVEAGLTVAYSVFAQRAGSASAPASVGPLLAAFEAADVRATVSSGEVRLSWALPSANAAVEVERSSSEGTVTIKAGADGLVDTNVVNGQRYDYRVRVRYGRELTDGVEVSATPAEPPRAVTLQGLEATGGGVEITWAPPPNGVVSLIRSLKRLDFAPETEIRRTDMSSLGMILPGSGGSATDPSASDGAWYTPVNVVGDRAVVGTPLRWTDIPAISGVRVRDEGGEAVVSWSWPPNVRHAVVVWREGSAPQGLDDGAAHRATVNRAAQQEVGGGVFRMARDRAGEPLRLQVHGAQMRDGELVVGSRLVATSRGSLNPAMTRETISYDLKVKGGLRGKSLQFVLSGAASFPEVVLVARPGDVMLLERGAGQPVARLGGQGGAAEVVVPMGSLPKERPLTVRAFLAADSAGASFSLRDPADLTKLTLR
jgi:hypothetical protein